MIVRVAKARQVTMVRTRSQGDGGSSPVAAVSTDVGSGSDRAMVWSSAGVGAVVTGRGCLAADEAAMRVFGCCAWGVSRRGPSGGLSSPMLARCRARRAGKVWSGGSVSERLRAASRAARSGCRGCRGRCAGLGIDISSCIWAPTMGSVNLCSVGSVHLGLRRRLGWLLAWPDAVSGGWARRPGGRRRVGRIWRGRPQVSRGWHRLLIRGIGLAVVGRDLGPGLGEVVVTTTSHDPRATIGSGLTRCCGAFQRLTSEQRTVVLPGVVAWSRP